MFNNITLMYPVVDMILDAKSLTMRRRSRWVKVHGGVNNATLVAAKAHLLEKIPSANVSYQIMNF